jgi:hypothetical protein
VIAAVNPTARRKTSKRQSRLRFQILNSFVDQSMASLAPHAAVVWFVLYRDTRRDGTACASVDDMARRAGIARRTVLNAIARLKELKMLRVVKRGGLNRGASIYIVFPVPME